MWKRPWSPRRRTLSTRPRTAADNGERIHVACHAATSWRHAPQGEPRVYRARSQSGNAVALPHGRCRSRRPPGELVSQHRCARPGLTPRAHRPDCRGGQMDEDSVHRCSTCPAFAELPGEGGTGTCRKSRRAGHRPRPPGELPRMCGILGFAGSPDRQLLGRMAAALVHRGPDDAGAFESPNVSLGHRRLSIIDRAGGHQPIANEDDTVWLVYNGEVYNYRELRDELIAAGHAFRTSCDSEVIVHAYEEWGAACAARFNGMWAFAVADLREGDGKLVLNRDHFGIKPLYYARSPRTGRLLFASEIKALLQDPDVVAEPDEQMVFEYLQHGFHDHRAETFFRGVYHVPAATWIELPLGGDAATGPLAAALESTPYWTPRLSTDGASDPADFRRRFRESVERRLVSEVPVGSCLSGGLDSTTIVSFMSELLKEDVPDATSLRGQLKTFSAVFDGDPIDEREYIEIAVESTGADTTYTNPTSYEFVDELRDFIWHQEEPIVSTGPYAQWCVMRSAREQVTVLLDGQGGDELIAGYVPYQLVYLRQLRKQGKYAELRREAAKSRDVLWPLARRRLSQRRKRLRTRRLLRPAFLARTTDPGYGRSQDDLC